MKKFLILLLLTLILMLNAAMAEVSFPEGLTVIEDEAFYAADLNGVLRLPDGIEQVGNYAFANTSLDGLIIPPSCRQVGKSVLWRARADYLYLESADTVLLGDPLAFFVFAPSGSSALAGTDLYDFPTESLAVMDGVYYTVADNARPLCAVERTRLGETVTIPKLVNGKPVTTLFLLCTEGWDHVQEVRIPAYLADTSPVAATTYETMSVTAPVPSVAAPIVGETITWTTQTEGAYGTVAYHWTATVNGESYSDLTTVPEYTFTPSAEGEITVSVRAEDAVGDSAQAAGTPVTVTNGIPQYRALLIGNTYPGTTSELHGCDTDANSIARMLSRMTGTAYTTNTQLNLSSTSIKNAIASTFAGARPCDVSLFFFSGHGTSAGSLVGTGNTYVSMNNLRSWLDAVPGTKIVIINACHSGMIINKSADSSGPSSFNRAVIRAFSSQSRAAGLATDGYIVLTACSQDQLSYNLYFGTNRFGAFTFGVCCGSGYDSWYQRHLSSMSADTDKNGEITLLECYNEALYYVEWLKTQVEIEDFTQIAQYYGDKDFVLWKK